MSLLAYNLTGLPLTLAAGNPPRDLPADGSAMNVTAELQGLAPADYDAIQVQVVALEVRLDWTGAPEFNIGSVTAAPVGGEPLGGGSIFVYREGEPSPTGNIYATWADAYAARQAIPGPAIIEIDGSLDTCWVRSGGPTYDLNNTALVGIRKSYFGNESLYLEDGVTFTSFRDLRFLNCYSYSNSAVITLTSTNDMLTMVSATSGMEITVMGWIGVNFRSKSSPPCQLNSRRVRFPALT